MSKEGSAEKTTRNIRRKTRWHYSSEEKIRIVLEGLRGEESIATPCRREGVALPKKTWTPPPIQGFSAKPANSMKTKPMAKAVVRQLEPLLTIDSFSDD